MLMLIIEDCRNIDVENSTYLWALMGETPVTWEVRHLRREVGFTIRKNKVKTLTSLTPGDMRLVLRTMPQSALRPLSPRKMMLEQSIVPLMCATGMVKGVYLVPMTSTAQKWYFRLRSGQSLR